MATEAEMKEKWCSFASVIIAGREMPSNRHSNGDIPESCKCLGSDCGSWGWEMECTNHVEAEAEGVSRRHRKSTIYGYCRRQ